MFVCFLFMFVYVCLCSCLFFSIHSCLSVSSKKNKEAYVNLGGAYLETGDPRKGIEILEKAIVA